jgi:ubiquinone/menaquinone biosynthesis C-methylase UbiE
MNEQDVPSPIDLCDPTDAQEWERTAPARPGRAEMFEAFSRELGALGNRPLTVLELGSGPGFLAACLLNALPDLNLTLLDFSAPMHDLARARLGSHAGRVTHVERSFKQPGWSHGLGPFDAAVTNQAVHELRHKRHATALHAAVRAVLKPGAPYLVSDHFLGPGGVGNDQLYMTLAEHRDALLNAGFSEVALVTMAGSLVMHRVI